MGNEPYVDMPSCTCPVAPDQTTHFRRHSAAVRRGLEKGLPRFKWRLVLGHPQRELDRGIAERLLGKKNSEQLSEQK